MLTNGYKPLLLAETLWYLLKWDRTINKQPFSKWQHHLNTAPFVGNSLTGQHKQHLSDLQLQSLRKHIDMIVRRSPKPFNCMRRCLTLKSMIEKRGGHCRLHIGVKISREKNNMLAAHAWVSANDKVVNDTRDIIEQYQEITHDNALFQQTLKTINSPTINY